LDGFSTLHAEANEELTVSTLGEVIVGVLYFSDLLPTF
jgi:hypothetical protein